MGDDLSKLLQEIHRQRDQELRDKYQRSLPFADGQFDRWERAKRLGFGEGATIYDSCCIFGKVRVGAMTWIGPFTMLDGSGGGLSVGAYCSISAGVHIYTHDTVLWALSGGKMPTRKGAVSVGDNVYIGSQSVIVTGVTISRRSVIAANSLVNKDVAEGSIVGGCPAVVIGRVEGEHEAVKLIYKKPE